MSKSYISIDLKSFFASVECVERNLNPMNTNLVVADESRTEKTICLAVTPPLKSYGISGRARLFEVVQKVKEVNLQRRKNAPGHKLIGKSCFADELQANPKRALDYIVAVPRMSLYMEYSTRIYQIYLKYVAPEDISVYSVDEVFMDVTHYLKTYRLTARELASKIIRDVYNTTGITATAGIGTNLYLAKVAMDIMAKHIEPDENGQRIAELDEMSYRRSLWTHRPLTDFWRVGRGYAKKLEQYGILTMGDIARCSLGKETNYYNEELLYKLFGVNAELLIDHAWGYEPCTMADIKAYKPSSSSMGVGQVLQSPYSFDMARLIVREMIDGLALDLVAKGLVTNQIVLNVGYDIENLSNNTGQYNGEITTDFYGRKVPKHAHGSENLNGYTSSAKIITDAAVRLYDRIVDRNLTVRRINVVANRIMEEKTVELQPAFEQLDLFTDYEKEAQKRAREKERLTKEKNLQKALLAVKKQYGKNAVIKGMNMEEGATQTERNKMRGGHKA